MRLSPRAKRADANEGLRSLLVHRLRTTNKAVWRWSLRGDSSSMFCEPCQRWAQLNDEPDPTWKCVECGRRYEVEMVVYSEVPPDVESEA
jgi:hypothetical protein